MEKLQQSVSKFVQRHHLETDVAHRLLDAVSELGEVAKETLKGYSYGRTAFKPTETWEEELGDVLFSLICVANTTNVNLETALVTVLKKYELRLQTKGGASSGV